MTQPGDLSLEDVVRLKDIRDNIRRAIELITRFQDDKYQERKRQEELQYQLNQEREHVRNLRDQLDHERRRQQNLQVLLDQERQRRERETAQLKERINYALQRGLAELFSVLGINNPWHEAAVLRQKNTELEKQVAAIQLDLERMKGSKASLQRENEQLRNELAMSPDLERTQIFASLLNHLGVSQLAPLLSGQNCEADKETAIVLLQRLITYLQGQRIKVSDIPGDIVHLKDERDLLRYEIDEKFQVGSAEVIQHGISYRDQFIIKARVRYKEEQANEPKSNGGADPSPQQ